MKRLKADKLQEVLEQFGVDVVLETPSYFGRLDECGGEEVEANRIVVQVDEEEERDG